MSVFLMYIKVTMCTPYSEDCDMESDNAFAVAQCFQPSMIRGDLFKSINVTILAQSHTVPQNDYDPRERAAETECYLCQGKGVMAWWGK